MNSHMRLLSRVLFVLVLSLIAIALPAAPAQAQCGIFIELSPEYGLPGTNVTVSGHGFAAGVLVDIYYDGTAEDDRIDTLTTGGNGDFTIVITIPEGCQGHHEVSARGKYASADTYFTVEPGLTMTPENGPVGTTVAVEGKGFAKNEDGIELLYYYLNGDYKTVESNIIANSKGSWQTSFQVPLSTRGKHKIDADGAETKLYQVKDATFTVTAQISLDESSGFVGDPVTMTGSRFAAHEKGIQVLFDGQAVVTDIKADSEGEWEASFEVPEMPTGGHGVTAQGEQTSKEDVGDLSFEIKPDIVLSPTEGHVATNLTVTGHGFAADETVDIMYDGSVIATAETDDEGNFEASLPAPESQYGEHLVAAGYGGENHANAPFAMESVPPGRPALISPSNRSRVGLIGREVTPTLEWSAVSDDSGVRYSLQIATSDDFDESSMIASVTGLTETSYTLDRALPYGTYYWIVQAVDGAQNESGWTTAGSFRIGLLPLWGSIVIAVALVVFLAALIRALVRRRGIYYDRW
jgi:hypothetical protein